MWCASCSATLTAAGIETDDAKIREALGYQQEAEARRQVMEQMNL